MAILGSVMEGVGIAILAITLYFAYELYTSIGGLSVLSSLPLLPANASISKSVSGLVSGLLSSSNSFMMLLLKIVLLFLFANIGYKFVALGINMNKAVAAAQNQKQTGKEGMNKY
ncbi:MAG: hypothetical protein ACP5GD_02935 [Candidatus Micrarchaeia archaeon]